MTEEEAKTKWCPKYQASAAEGADNRPLGKGPDGRLDINTMHRDSCCIASACMAWRWVPNTECDEHGVIYQIQPNAGYCGLAGKP